MLRFFYPALLLTLCQVLSGSVLASQDTQTPLATVKPLANADVLEMLSAGLSQEIVIAKITASACEFDTSPSALKVLKATNVPDAVILVMVQAPTGSPRQVVTNAEPSAPAWIYCKYAGPVSVYAAPRTRSVESFTVKCGDRITLLNPDDGQSWFKIRTVDGQVGYISFVLISREQSESHAQEEHPSSEPKKREDIQKASDDLEDCRVRSQNEYETKMNTIGTMVLAPMVRVVASRRLKQNLDAELRACRSQYELRLKATENKQ